MDNSKLRLVIEAVISTLILCLCAGAEIYVITSGLPKNVDPVIGGRILGTLDAVILLVATYWFGSSTGARQQVEAITRIGEAAAQTPINIHMPDGTLLRQTTVATEAAIASQVPTQTDSHM